MTASVQLILGDLFDGPSDLIVLPCSTVGTVTESVRTRLAQYALPTPGAGLKFGEVVFLPFDGGENIAQFVAFAASVHVAFAQAMISIAGRVQAIENIALALGEFTKQQASVRSINVPLLGTGSGGLDADVVVAALKAAFVRSAHPHAVLNIYVLQQSEFDRLRKNTPATVAPTSKPVRVFISHTSVTPAAVLWVKELAKFLIGRGIQARLDQFDLRRGMDLPQWMTNELSLADKVVIVSDELFKQKADGRLGGVGWETMIIQGDMLHSSDPTKYQVVVRSEKLSDGLPIYLRAKYVFHAWPHDDLDAFRRELVHTLMEPPAGIEPNARAFTA